MNAQKQLAKYTVDNGDEIVLTPGNVREIISTDSNITDREMYLFAALCKSQRLNPFVKEAYLVKYGSQPATMVVGKDVFTKRATKNPRYRGLEAGISVRTQDGRFVRRDGSMVLPGEEIQGGWCKVHVDGYEVPMFDEVAFTEYAGYKKDGTLNKTWAGKPGTMIRKVALVHALREAFPDDFQGLYDSAEMGIEDSGEPVPAEIIQPMQEPEYYPGEQEADYDYYEPRVTQEAVEQKESF